MGRRKYTDEERRERKAKYYRQRYLEFKKWYDKQLENKVCERCSTNTKLLFHHVEPLLRLFSITDRWKYKREQVLDEIKKCKIVCRHCHAKIHGGLLNQGVWLIIAIMGCSLYFG